MPLARSPFVRGLLALTALVVALLWAGLQWQRTRNTGNLERRPLLETTGQVPDRLQESSGVAVSRTQPGVLWSHNDSGDGPTLYAIDASGTLLASIRVTGAWSLDWEDIAEGPCPSPLPTDGTSGDDPRCLYIADIGDNKRVRDHVSVHIVVEPRRTSGGTWPQTAAARSFSYRYPEGPDDSEALAVAPGGDVVVVTKGRTGAIDVFAIPAAPMRDALDSGSVVTATRAFRTGIEPDADTGRLVTGAAIAPSGRTMAVRTYNEVYFFDAVAEQPGVWREAGRRCAIGSREPLGEAIDFLDEDTLILTSERARGLPGYIHRLRC